MFDLSQIGFGCSNFRKCAPRLCASPSSWHARAGPLSRVCDTSIRSQEVTATLATNEWTWPNRRAMSCAPCGGTRKGRAELLKPTADTRHTRTIPIYGRVPQDFPIALNFPEDTHEVRLLRFFQSAKSRRIFAKFFKKVLMSNVYKKKIEVIFFYVKS